MFLNFYLLSDFVVLLNFYLFPDFVVLRKFYLFSDFVMFRKFYLFPDFVVFHNFYILSHFVVFHKFYLFPDFVVLRKFDILPHFEVFHKFLLISRFCGARNVYILSDFVVLRNFYLLPELVILPEHLSSTPVFSGVRVTRSLVLCVCFVDRCLFLCTFSFDHYVTSVLLRYTDSDYLLGIFKLFFVVFRYFYVLPHSVLFHKFDLLPNFNIYLLPDFQVDFVSCLI